MEAKTSTNDALPTSNHMYHWESCSCFTSAIALGRLEQEDQEFRDSLVYIANLRLAWDRFENSNKKTINLKKEDNIK